MNIPLDRILPNPAQPRKQFDKDALGELAASIRENGVILPVAVEEAAGGMYILHDGERRVRASRLAGLTEIPAAVMPPLNGSGPTERLVRAMVANIQRADLNPIEEAEAYKRMRDELHMPDNTIALKLGIGVHKISRALELLELEKPIQKLIEAKRLTKDARLVHALLSIPSSEARVKLAEQLANNSPSIKAAVEACERVKGALAAERVSTGEVPSLLFAARKGGAVDRPLWDAFAQAGAVPPWPKVEASARACCDRCGLRDQASSTTCSGCVLVEMLVELIGQTGRKIDRRVFHGS